MNLAYYVQLVYIRIHMFICISSQHIAYYMHHTTSNKYNTTTGNGKMCMHAIVIIMHTMHALNNIKSYHKLIILIMQASPEFRSELCFWTVAESTAVVLGEECKRAYTCICMSCREGEFLVWDMANNIIWHLVTSVKKLLLEVLRNFL